MRKWSKRVTVSAVFAGLALVGGVAFAAWTATGSGAGSAKATHLSFTVGSEDVSAYTGTALLYPGYAGGSLAVKVTNTSPFSITVSDVSWTGGTAASSASSGKGTCTGATGPGTVTLNGTGTVHNAESQAIAVGGSFQFDLANAVSMSTSAADGCQDASFAFGATDITVTANQT